MLYNCKFWSLSCTDWINENEAGNGHNSDLLWKSLFSWLVAVAQLTEWLLLTPEDLDLNLAISQYFKNINLMLALKMTKIKKKKPGVAHCLKASFLKKFKFKFDWDNSATFELPENQDADDRLTDEV